MKYLFSPFGLKLKLALWVVTLILVIMSSIVFLFGLRHEQTLRNEMQKRAAAIAQITGSMSLLQIGGASFWDLSKGSAFLIAQLDPNLLYILVFDKTGKMQAASVNRSLLQILSNREEIDSVERGLMTELSRPVGRGNRSLASQLEPLLPIEIDLRPKEAYQGRISIGFSLREMEREIFYSRLTAAGLTFCFLLLGVMVAFGVASSITQPVSVLVRGMEEVRKGNLKLEVQIPNKDEIGILAGAFNFMIAGLRERERIKGTFKRYVSKQVAEKLLEEKEVVVTGERRRVSILFSDIRGFTSMAERMAPEEVVSMLNEYFSVMIDIIFAHEGTLDKFIGDAIMALFGAPISHPDDPLRAVRTAIAMQRALVNLNEERDRRGAEAIYVGIGISTGDVVAGNIGSEKRMEYSVIGDDVNLAARLQARCRRQKIYICPETYLVVKSEVKAIPLEPVILKGRSHPTQIYEVVY